MRFLFVLLIAAGCGHSTAVPDAPPADFAVTAGWSTGSLPPQYHHSWRLDVATDGAGTLAAETGYGDGPSRTWTFRLADTDRDSLYTSLLTGDAFRAWSEDRDPPVGGASWWARIQAGGETTEIPHFVTRRQNADKESLERVMRKAVPASVWAEHLNWLAEARATLDGG